MYATPPGVFGSGRGTTEFPLQVPQGGRVRLTAQDTQTLEFRQWRGGPLEARTVLTEPLNQNTVVVAEYQRVEDGGGGGRGGGERVTLWVRAWRASETQGWQQISVFVDSGHTKCSKPTPYSCQVDRNEVVVELTVPQTAQGGSFAQWWECPANYNNPPQQPQCTPRVTIPFIEVTMNQSKTIVAVYGAP